MNAISDAQLAQLEKLHRLKEQGALTQDEFELQKAELLRARAVGVGVIRNPLVWLAITVLAAGIGVGLWSRPETSGPSTNASTSAGQRRAVPLNQPPAEAAQISPTERLALASLAAIGTRGLKKEISNGDEITTRARQILDLPFGPVLLTERSIKDGCHACAGTIGVYYLEQTGQTLRVKGRYPKAVEGWGWGAAPEYTITAKFTAFPAIYSEGGGGGQGYFCTGSTLVELTPSGPIESDLINTGFSDSGAIVDDERPAREIKGKIANIRKAKSFDVEARGSENFTEHYLYRGGRFVRTVKNSALQC